MAVFMNAKGTQNSVFQIGKRGSKIFGSTVTPTASEVSTGDLWFDVSNNETKIASKPGDTVTWNKIITENFGDVTITGNLTVSGTTTTVNSTTVEVQNSIVLEGATADAHEVTLTTVDPTADRTIRLPNASGTLTLSGAIGVDDLEATAYVATGEVWNDNDSEVATTGRISDFIGTEIANSTVIMHTTGNESFAGNKTFTGTTQINALDVNGAYTFPTSDGSANQILQTDGSGTLSFATNSPTPAGSNTHVQFNDGGAIAGNSNLVFDKATNRLTVTNLTVNSQFSFTSDYGSIASAVTVTDDFGSTADDTRTPTPHDSYTVTEAGNITGMSAGDMIFVSNETGGATMAFYDGSNWRRVQDRAIIS